MTTNTSARADPSLTARSAARASSEPPALAEPDAVDVTAAHEVDYRVDHDVGLPLPTAGHAARYVFGDAVVVYGFVEPVEGRYKLLSGKCSMPGMSEYPPGPICRLFGSTIAGAAGRLVTGPIPRDTTISTCRSDPAYPATRTGRPHNPAPGLRGFRAMPEIR